MEVRRVRVNGQPGLVITVDGQLIQVLTLDVADGRIANCFVVRNPDKLARVGKTWEDESPCEPTTNAGSGGASPSR